MLDPLHPELSTIEGVPIKEVMIDAICGARFGGQKMVDWAASNGLADPGDQWTEPEWDRDRLDVLSLDALFAVYGRVKRK